MYNLVVIGNGFDLAHGSKTDYTSFIRHVVNCHYDGTFSGTMLFTPKSRDFTIKNYDELIQKMEEKPLELIAFIRNHFFAVLLESHNENNWSGIETIYMQQLRLVQINDKTRRFKTIEELNESFEEVKSSLESYIQTERKENKPKMLKGFQHLFKKIENKKTLIVNFNYTDTVRDYEEVNESEIIHIHGKIKSKHNPIIFGYAATDKEARELIELDDNEYLRNIKKNCYKRTISETVIRDYLDGTKNIDVTVIGHSCGLSDKLILNQIFNHENINSIRILYHDKFENYFQTQVNMDRIMKDDIKFKKLISYEKEFRFPSIEETQEKHGFFIKYIDSMIDQQFLEIERSNPYK